MHTNCLQLGGHRLGVLLRGRLLAWVDLVPVSNPALFFGFFFDHLVFLVRCPCNHLSRRADRRAAPGTMKIAPGMGSMVMSAKILLLSCRSCCKILLLSASAKSSFCLRPALCQTSRQFQTHMA